MAPVQQIPDEMAADPNLRHFWEKRHLIFSKFDDGIKIRDPYMWHKITPEENAVEHAQRFKGKKTVVDGFGGCGGNSIQLAKVVDKVYYVEWNSKRVEEAKHNAKVYGVEHKIEFICDDFMEVSKTLRADGIFLSPPWTTKMMNGYSDYKNFDIRRMQPIGGDTVFTAARQISANVALFMPPTTPFYQLAKLANPGEHVEFENAPNPFISGTVFAVTAYYGDLAKTY